MFGEFDGGGTICKNKNKFDMPYNRLEYLTEQMSKRSLFDLEAACDDEFDYMSQCQQDEDPTESDCEFIASEDDEGRTFGSCLQHAACDNEEGSATPSPPMLKRSKTFRVPRVTFEDSDSEEEVRAHGPPPPKKAAPKKKATALLYVGKGHFLTWPKVPASWTKEQMVQACKDKVSGISYVVMGLEAHEDGTPHFHAFIKTEEPVRVRCDTWVIEIDGVERRGRWLSAKSYKACKKYVEKGGDYITDGDFDLAIYEAAVVGRKSYIATYAMEHGMAAAVRKDPALIFDYAKVQMGLRLYEEDCAKEKMTMAEPEVWKEFQKTVLNTIDEPPHPRHIHWIVDEVGNSGKTFMAKWLCINKGAALLGGKRSDCYACYQGESTVIFDVPRQLGEDTMDHIYGTIEKIKDGHFMSGKYVPVQRCWEIPHVFVFANWWPNMDALSKDRWDIWVITQEGEEVQRMNAEQSASQRPIFNLSASA